MADALKTAVNNGELDGRTVVAETPSADELDVLDVLADLGASSDVKIVVYRQMKGRAISAPLLTRTPDEYDLDEITQCLRDEWGGGEFRIQVKQGVQFKLNRPLVVEMPTNAVRRPVVAPVAPAATDMNGVLMQMQENARLQMDAMRDMMLAQTQNTNNMLLQLVTADRQQPSQEGNSIKELFTIITGTQALFGDKRDGIGPEKMLEMFFEGMKQGREMNGESGGGILEKAIEAFGPAIGEITKNLGQAAATAPPPGRLVPPPQRPQGGPVRPVPAPANPINPSDRPTRDPAQAPTIQPSAPATAAELPQEQTMLTNDQATALQQLTPFLQMFMGAAKINADTEVYANLVVDQIEAGGVSRDTIDQWVVSDSGYELVLQYLPPEINADDEVRQWFDELREAVIALLTDEQENAAPGHVDNASNVIGNVHGQREFDAPVSNAAAIAADFHDEDESEFT